MSVARDSLGAAKQKKISKYERAILQKLNGKNGMKSWKVLEDHKNHWNTTQKELLSIKVKEKLSKCEKSKNTKRSCYKVAKTGEIHVQHYQSCTVFFAKPDLKEKNLKTELISYRSIHKSDILARPDLHKLNKIVHDKTSGKPSDFVDYAKGSIANLSSNEDALNMIKWLKAHQQLHNNNLTLRTSTLIIHYLY